MISLEYLKYLIDFTYSIVTLFAPIAYKVCMRIAKNLVKDYSW